MMCQNYEKQLQRLQKEFNAVQDKEKLLVGNVKSLQVHPIYNIFVVSAKIKVRYIMWSVVVIDNTETFLINIIKTTRSLCRFTIYFIIQDRQFELFFY